MRAALSEEPEDYAWPSARGNFGLRRDALPAPHASYLSLASSDHGYRRWLEADIDEAELAGMRLHLKQERALGDRGFQAIVEKTLGRPVASRPPGRPVKGRA